MKRLILPFAMLSAVLFLGAGCATSKHEEVRQPAAVTSTPSPALAQPEVVTPAVSLPPAETK
jgi:Na+/H+ antiporter NhaC